MQKDSKETLPLVTIFVIATNRYKGFVPELMESIEKYLLSPEHVEVVLLTDDLDFYNPSKFDRNLNVRFFKIPAYGWPEATLLRYQMMKSAWDLVRGEIVFYLDVDTKFVNPVSKMELESAFNGRDLCLVAHPGYYKRSSIVRLANKISFKIGWETRKKSVAYVPFWRRKTYVCGGVWFGKKFEIYKMICELSRAVESDSASGVIAKFHDESHLNMWLSKNSHSISILSPKWAYAPQYSNLREITPLLEVLDKPSEYNAVK